MPVTPYQQLELFELTEAICDTAKRIAEGEIVTAEDKLDLAEQLWEARQRMPADREFGAWWRTTEIGYGHEWRAVLLRAGKRIAKEGRPGLHLVETGGEFSIRRFADTGDGWITGDASTFDTNHSGQEAWFTPRWVFEGLDIPFDLDVAAPPGGVPWIPADHYYTEQDDGLAQPWHGTVWCNPPYSAPTPWCERFATYPDDMALLIRADLSTGGPFAAFAAAHTIWVPDGRLDFVDGVGTRGGAVTFSTVMLGRGPTVSFAMQRLANVAGGTTRQFA